MWTIYALRDPRDGSVKYIGETVSPLHVRLSAHRAEAHTRNPYLRARLNAKHRWILDLEDSGLVPEIVALDWYQEWPAEKAARVAVERQWIEAFVEAGATLFNIGGHPVNAREAACAAWRRVPFEQRYGRLLRARWAEPVLESEAR